MRLIDPELLRTFIAFVDAGSLARAAEIVGRTPSAITAQMQRLEETIGGGPLLAQSGRGRVLTPLGDDLAIHARRILDAHREAWLSLKGASADGRVGIGATQDFADSTLPDLLRTFATTHPRVRMDLRVGRTVELTKAFDEGAIDVLLVMRREATADEIGVVREPMLWLMRAGGLSAPTNDLPLALLDPPCGFRSAAIAALDQARRPYRIAATSGSLSGLAAAVRSGVALTVRTARMLGNEIVEASPALQLPKMPEAEFSIRLRRDAEPAAESLAEVLCEGLQGVGAIAVSRPKA
jgi:DNA-binding transcriptional LysR family regulator